MLMEQLGHARDETALIDDQTIKHIAKQLKMDERDRSTQWMYKESPVTQNKDPQPVDPVFSEPMQTYSPIVHYRTQPKETPAIVDYKGSFDMPKMEQRHFVE